MYSQRAWDRLVEYANHRKTIAYSLLEEEVDLANGRQNYSYTGRVARHFLDPIQRYCRERSLPVLSVLAVDKNSGLQGEGYQVDSGKTIAEEMEEVYEFDWFQLDNPFSNKNRQTSGTSQGKSSISVSALERAYQEVVSLLSVLDEKPSSLKSSAFVSQTESYKESIYNHAHSALMFSHWKESDIGTGRIKRFVEIALSVKPGGKDNANNLIHWTERDNFFKLEPSNQLESHLYDLYKNKRSDGLHFEALLNTGLRYQIIAYLFFIKNKDRYIPISQQRFDQIFTTLGQIDFKTNNNASWENYVEYVDYVRQVKKFLKTKESDVSLLDAHSFLWILGRLDELKEESTLIGSSIQRSDKITPTDQDTSASTSNNFGPIVPALTDELYEGTIKKIASNVVERNPAARAQCISHYGTKCAVCGFDFELVYGEVGKGYIHVHHLNPLAKANGARHVNPVEDLIPVCANCHAMLHRRKEPYTVAELKSMMP